MDRKDITALKCVVRPRRWNGSFLGNIREKQASDSFGLHFVADSMGLNSNTST